MKLFISLLLSALTLNANAFQDYNSESKRVTKEIGCAKPKVTPGSKNWGALYMCIGGVGETVKLFINKEKGTGKVKNIKFMWNDWTKDIGEGIHTDAAVAKAWVATMSTTYAPGKVEEVINTFFGSTSRSIESSTHILKYTYHVGPAIDERLFVITTKQQASAKAATVRAVKSDFQACKSAIANTVNYRESLLSGDGDPVQESGYKSFYIDGKGKDMFFCEVHSRNKYKIKAALGGRFPFKYIAQGNLK